ncbi:carbamoyltransferase HypF [Desulfitobacterium hafniense]|uniref:Carbamoyltransferase n=5 Tax=root TaxID=1 RepID=Q24UM6_DESHY|nr:carbamoyltransferase HypF [Desulfitobacterium hafniense]ACL21653.1 (NiFe) hydrogenase maturation protein HypF [Desulfitobacterium hafniense DCB-2]EHL07658.1 carbamoyltransferase HypF [Desulfitobacterium hafniense DP7]KTE89694.1 hydrogenase maturation protein HypF [Desulfitobacterium hafniense]MEA5023333.1 carbamoyltransferase HypF [Desulfitobacterium hafniense]CDX02570.1 Hydrogenase maturation protein Carbamoyltransferase hypF [Desulfitobacterium hafniense]
MTTAYFIHLNGIVQGVGFRPYVYRLAHEMGIKGWVNNSSHGVYIHAEGLQVPVFYRRLLQEVPPLAKITHEEYREVAFGNYADFAILQSREEGQADVLISPDIATCGDCLAELRDVQDLRYRYPFINCTNCGPRYTIIQDVPYDRAQTTMQSFPMCPVCAQEYADPLNRRFHAQPVACSQCGPAVQLLNAQGDFCAGLGIEQIARGEIIAIKGLGGFHLVCDGGNPTAVQRLRQRKERGAKPFALMARNLEVIRRYLKVSLKEEELLKSSAAPIVILERKKESGNVLPDELAPGLHTLGVMLPYTPLHALLFDGAFDFLVMTSGNLSGRPLIYTNEEAVRELKGIADYFLLHNRDIFHPCDDSVVQVIGDEAVLHRRARGYVPLPQKCPQDLKASILGVGGELKNAFCLGAKDRAFTSQYIGDMEGYENFQRFRQELASFQKVVQIVPEVVAYDAHPDFQTTQFALAGPWPQKIKVQHHHAHLVSVLGEHGITAPALGVVCDGTGWGEDRRIWGFEFLKGNAEGYRRLAHLEYLPLPGGDAGAKHPLRIAYAYGKSLLSEREWLMTERLWERLAGAEQKILDQQLEKRLQIFETSSGGRLFDAVSALLGICTSVTYEGQAAIELESKAALWSGKNSEDALEPRYLIEWAENGECLILKVKELYWGIIQDVLDGKEPAFIAYHFHDSLAHGIVRTVLELQVGEGPLVLTGGVFQNKLLTEKVLVLCKAFGIQVIRAKELPPGDGGLALGQILIGNERCS